MKDLIERLSWLIKTIGALIALLPSVAVLLGLVDIPPDVEDLINLISFSISFATILVVFLLTAKITRMRNGVAAIIIVACVLGGSICAFVYRDYASSHIVVLGRGEKEERIVIPDRPPKDLLELVRPFGGDYVEALEVHVRRDQLRAMMEAENGAATAKIIIYLVLAQMLITAGLVFGAWKLTSMYKNRP